MKETHTYSICRQIRFNQNKAPFFGTYLNREHFCQNNYYCQLKSGGTKFLRRIFTGGNVNIRLIIFSKKWRKKPLKPYDAKQTSIRYY